MAEERIEPMEHAAAFALGNALIVVAIIGYIAFVQWIKHQRRVLVHRERLAAIEKGVELPAVEQEVRRSSFNVQRMLLLSGLIWISLGVGAYVVLSAILSYPISDATTDIPKGIQMIGIAPIGIGLAHLVAYWAGSTHNNQP